jgi:hypothetical protein
MDSDPFKQQGVNRTKGAAQAAPFGFDGASD